MIEADLEAMLGLQRVRHLSGLHCVDRHEQLRVERCDDVAEIDGTHALVCVLAHNDRIAVAKAR